MPDTDRLITWLGAVVVAAPAALVLVLGIPALLGRRLSETTTVRAARAAIVVGLLACLAVLALIPITGGRPAIVDLGDWVALRPAGAGHDHYHFAVEFEFDLLSVPLALLSFLLCGIIAGFATRYLHREPGSTGSSSCSPCSCSGW